MGGELIKLGSLSFCLNKASSSSEPAGLVLELPSRVGAGLTNPIFQFLVFALWGVAARKDRVFHYRKARIHDGNVSVHRITNEPHDTKPSPGLTFIKRTLREGR